MKAEDQTAFEYACKKLNIPTNSVVVESLWEAAIAEAEVRRGQYE